MGGGEAGSSLPAKASHNNHKTSTMDEVNRIGEPHYKGWAY
jgi:hypothetical protein